METLIKYLKRPKFGHTIIKVPNSGHWILGGDEAGKFFTTCYVLLKHPIILKFKLNLRYCTNFRQWDNTTNRYVHRQKTRSSSWFDCRRLMSKCILNCLTIKAKNKIITNNLYSTKVIFKSIKS